MYHDAAAGATARRTHRMLASGPRFAALILCLLTLAACGYSQTIPVDGSAAGTAMQQGEWA